MSEGGKWATQELAKAALASGPALWGTERGRMRAQTEGGICPAAKWWSQDLN